MTNTFEDEWALRRLAETYGFAMDRRDAGMLKPLFTDDAVIESVFRAQRGIAEILGIPDMLTKMYASTLHAVHNQSVTVTGDIAEGETYCIAYHLKHPKDGKNMRFDYGLKYQDSFRRVNGAWRFSRRYLKIEWTQLSEVQIPSAPAA